MIFNSYVFFAFLLVVLFLYGRLGHSNQNRLLLVASYIFYGYWDYRFLALMCASTAADYYLGLKIGTEKVASRRRLLIVMSVVVNLTFLGFFKYYNFFATELNDVLIGFGFNNSLPLLKIVLPVGISFYTFQSMSYTIDVYRGTVKVAHKLSEFALYVAFFPQLVAGPIERSGTLLGQIQSPRVVRREDVSAGIYHILYGLFKKVVIADNMAVIANAVFAMPHGEQNGMLVMIGLYAFAFQIYCDFSGYSNIAQGAARLLGFRLSWNFRNPYFAVSPSDFWKRWHISLSSWLRDYVYIPLGGNRSGKRAMYFNLMATMILGGFWHGAAWTYLVWGLLHGLLLVGYRMIPVSGEICYADSLSPVQESKITLPRLFAALVFFHIICLTWLLFRAESMGQAAAMLGSFRHAVTLSPMVSYSIAMILVHVLPLLTFEFWLEQKGSQLAMLEQPLLVQAAFLGTLLLALVFLSPSAPQAFIYFQF